MRAHERTRHDELHALVATCVVGMIAATIYGIVVPPTITLVPLSYENIANTGRSLGELFLGIAFGIGGMVAGGLGWILLVERRPISSAWWRRPAGRDWVATIALVVSYLITQIVMGNVRLVGGFYGTFDDGVDLYVWAPPTLAVGFVVYLAILGATYAILRPIVDAWRSQRRVTFGVAD